MSKNIINEITKKFSLIIKQTVNIIKKDAIYGIRIGKIKLKEMKLEQKKLEKLIEIGRKTYQLYKKGLIKEEELQRLCNQLSILEKSAKEYHTLGEEYFKDKNI